MAGGETSSARGAGGELLRGGARHGRGGVVAGQEPRRRAGEVPIGPECGEETSGKQGGAILASLAVMATDQPALTCEVGAGEPHDCTNPQPRGGGRPEPGASRGVRSAGAQPREGCDTPPGRQEPPSRACGHGEVERIPAEGRAREQRASPGALVTGTPRAVVCDTSRGHVGPALVRAQVVRCTARKRGQSGDGGASGWLALGSQPLQRHVSGHLRASWGHGGAPLYARGIRIATPPGGASTEPRYGRGEAHQARAGRWQAYGQCQPKMGQEAA